MTTYDIVADIHGQAAKLHSALRGLGWRRAPSGWVSDDPGREVVLLGGFIDRGSENKAVLETVRSLMDAGKAQAAMGYHGLSALHFHTEDPETGEALRPRSAKNTKQHKAFLDEFPLGDAQTPFAAGLDRPVAAHS